MTNKNNSTFYRTSKKQDAKNPFGRGFFKKTKKEKLARIR